jgi:hypothetical protein
VIPSIAIAITVVLVRYVLAGSAMDISHSSWVLAPGVLALSMGCGLLSRSKLPYLADSMAVAVLVLMRGWACDASLAVLPPPWGGDVLAALLSLGPLGYFMGRQLSLLLPPGLMSPLLGWISGEILVAIGALAWCPGLLTGFLAAALVAALVEMGTGRRIPSARSDEDRVSWEAAPLGVVLALLLVVLRRVAPSYVSPTGDVTSEALLALLVPAALVAVFAVMLTGSSMARRTAYTAGCLGLAWACWHAVGLLGLYVDNMLMIQLTREYRMTANEGWPLVTEWHAWLMMFSGMSAAALGLALASLRRSAAGPLVLGLGLGLLAEAWVMSEPVMAPLHLLLAASGLAGACCLMSWNRRWVLLLPLAAVPFWLLPGPLWVGFDGVRRVGDYAADGWRRSVITDLTLFSTGNLDNLAVEGRRVARDSFSDRIPFLAFDDGGALLFKGQLVEPEEPSAAFEPGFDPDDDAPVKRYFGVRVAGVPMHPNHDPVGPEGSLGRLHRLLAVPGSALVLGVGAELVAADLLDAGLARQDDNTSAGLQAVTLATRVPMGGIIGRVLLDNLGLEAGLDVVGEDGLRALRAAPSGAFSSVVLSPEREGWPGAGWMLSNGVLERLADRLRPDGRLLAWVDTTDLDGRSLRARLAAFGDVFGTSCMALLELRELDAPFVLLVGWRDEAGRPTADELTQRMGVSDRSGFRTRLNTLDDLGAMLLFDGSGLAQLAGDGPVHARGRPVPPSLLADHGAAAVAAVYTPGARLSGVFEGGPDAERDLSALLAGMAQHSTYFYQLDRLRGAMMVEPLDDVDWAAHGVEVQAYARAAAVESDNPLLHLAIAALLEPLAREDDLSRFAQAFLTIDCEPMASWRLALLHHYVLVEGLEPELADAALDRARGLASWPAGG